jgi:putative membrane protein
MMYWWGQQMHGWGWVLMPLGSVLLLALVIAGVVAAIRLTDARGADRPPAPPATPATLLAERYARGEIDEVEYQHRVDVLNKTAGHGPPSGP